MAQVRGRWISLLYYYLAAMVGLVITLVGIIGGLQALVGAAFPQLSDEVRFSHQELRSPESAPPLKRGRDRDAPTEGELAAIRDEAEERARLNGFAGGLRGLIAALVGAPVFLWHIRQARRKEPEWFGPGNEEPPRDTREG